MTPIKINIIIECRFPFKIIIIITLIIIIMFINNAVDDVNDAVDVVDVVDVYFDDVSNIKL